ncbi:SIS domain-containing protein [Curtobacterium sp. Leaf261]|uniref:SIS domain-containing protein n=1 Tax=Curtobacterium sp. Leaf261 TaxID=1736311 RepID=UPI0006FB00B5|nr:SIS domain-containing protein [Curtobacterium sp. Leaf261]KQO63743.1 hypothetical protein ASF23_05880 [Curtobacterium sp. Leaf261]
MSDTTTIPRTTLTSITGQAGGTTAAEIERQPEVWRTVVANNTLRRDEIDAFLAPFAGGSGRVVLAGAGTSAFVGSVLAPALTRRLGRRVEALAITDIVSNPRECFGEDVPTLLVSFARSGDSPESLAATRLADQVLTDVRHLVITCSEQGALFAAHADRADSLTIAIPSANDQGFAMTSSFSGMLVAAWSAFVPDAVVAIERVAVAAERILAERVDDIVALAARGRDRIVYLGSGPLAGLARESALKLLELTAGSVVTYFDTALGFRHGPKAILDDDTLAVVFTSGDAYTRQYDDDIVAELRGAIGDEDVLVLTPGGQAERTTDVEQEWPVGVQDVDDALLALPYVVVAQIVGLAYSLRLGLTPDNPFPGNEVNRVVQGVTVHPLPDVPDTADRS